MKIKTDQLLSLFSELNFGLSLLDDQWCVQQVNPAWEKLICPARAVVGKPVQAVLPELVGFDGVLQDLRAGRLQFFELAFINRTDPSGNLHYVNLYLFPLQDAAFRLLCLIQDVSEVARMRQSMVQQENEIRLLESILDSQKEFISGSILGNSPPIRRLRQTIEQLSQVPNATILLEGESGTGKNLVARVIHFSAQEKQSPFVEINCAAIPETLIEAELFGYEKGAFTGAAQARAGLLEEANGGTLFLDEIGELPIHVQAKLLSFLESRRFRRLGSTREQEVQLRLISATNRNLEEMIEKGQFRQDLYYRLNVVKLHLPPLRQLGEDILYIAENFLTVFNIEFKKHITGFTPEARRKLLAYSWPGNVRELRNVLERAMIFARGPLLDASDLDLFAAEAGAEQPEAIPDRFSLPEEGISLEALEKHLLRQALERAGGNQSRAARLLGLSRDTFRYRLEKYKLN